MYYVYVLKSDKDRKLYTGFTNDLKKRLKEHIEGRVTSTKFRKPLKLVYYEAYTHREDVVRREKYLKSQGTSLRSATRPGPEPRASTAAEAPGQARGPADCGMGKRDLRNRLKEGLTG